MCKLDSNAGTILITGITASGKTTLGKQLFQNLVKAGIQKVKLLDGEEIRVELKKKGLNLGYSIEDRNTLVQEYAKIAQDYNVKGDTVIICTIASTKECRNAARKQLGNFMEVYLDCPVNECAKRDYKGHYKKALNGEYKTFIGVTDPYEISENPEVILRTGEMSIDQCSDILYEKVIAFLKKNGFM